MRWGKVTILGVGLLGGSIGLALRKRRLAREVYGFVRREATRREAIRAGAVDQAGMDLREAVRGADLVILATPIAQMEPLVVQMLPDLKRGALLTDVGSVKAPVVRWVASKIRKAGGEFVGSHPMAGSEKGGVEAARADLFRRAVCVVTPEAGTAEVAVGKVRRLWESLGAEVLILEAALHDQLVSRASHLPHLVAAALAAQVLDPRRDGRQSALCATGFRDTTRVACGSPAMRRDIALANRKHLVRDLASFEKRLAALRGWLRRGDAVAVERFLASAQRLRLGWGRRRAFTSEE